MRAVVTSSGFPALICDTPALTSTNASASGVTILAANDARVYACVFNDSTAMMYLAWGSTCTTTAYTTKLPPAGLYELPEIQGRVFAGPLSAVWASATGAARVTEGS